ncbi:hypothetical protein EXIGLDRAFT_838610 [Exidia glandulosa HHB12029]|uniref:Uncharacterized protein n=1 Tax=Exidia glandulosa HHB12029 TaxID=1314781 RepID=A0A165FP15_EXIGL|nr:hypothetical protein EXIGLDRAFT_838610 [Exidia glandulosa HHB12029]
MAVCGWASPFGLEPPPSNECAHLPLALALPFPSHLYNLHKPPRTLATLRTPLRVNASGLAPAPRQADVAAVHPYPELERKVKFVPAPLDLSSLLEIDLSTLSLDDAFSVNSPAEEPDYDSDESDDTVRQCITPPSSPAAENVPLTSGIDAEMRMALESRFARTVANNSATAPVEEALEEDANQDVPANDANESGLLAESSPEDTPPDEEPEPTTDHANWTTDNWIDAVHPSENDEWSAEATAWDAPIVDTTVDWSAGPSFDFGSPPFEGSDASPVPSDWSLPVGPQQGIHLDDVAEAGGPDETEDLANEVSNVPSTHQPNFVWEDDPVVADPTSERPIIIQLLNVTSNHLSFWQPFHPHIRCALALHPSLHPPRRLRVRLLALAQGQPFSWSAETELHCDLHDNVKLHADGEGTGRYSVHLTFPKAFFKLKRERMMQLEVFVLGSELDGEERVARETFSVSYLHSESECA